MRHHRHFPWRGLLLGAAVALALAVPVAFLVSKVGGSTRAATLLEDPALVAGTLIATTAVPTSAPTAELNSPTSTSLAPGTTIQAGNHARVIEITARSEGPADAWTARVAVHVGSNESPLGMTGVLVVGTWSGSTLDTHAATTDDAGIARFVMTGLTGPSTRFTVLDVIAEAVPYEPTINETTTVKVPGPAS